MSKPWLVTISGVIGSGKTTLAQALADHLGWTYIAESNHAAKYLTDLFTDPQRWAFEAQTAFIIHKSNQILSALKSKQNIILDRSLFEDSEVFAFYFHLKGYIDFRSFETYRAVADHLVREIPSPDLILLCKCSMRTIQTRLMTRDRDYESLYPLGFLNDIGELYEKWVASYRSSSMYALDSEAIDWRVPDVAKALSRNLEELLVQQKAATPSLSKQVSNRAESSKWFVPIHVTEVPGADI